MNAFDLVITIAFGSTLSAMLDKSLSLATGIAALAIPWLTVSVHTMSLEQFDKVVTVDLRGVFLCGREAAVHMARGGRGGVIFNISSISRGGNVGQSNHAAAKAGVSALTATWAAELAKYGIHVAGIAPGFTDTQMVASMKPALRDKFVQRIPCTVSAGPRKSRIPLLSSRMITSLEVDGGLQLCVVACTHQGRPRCGHRVLGIRGKRTRQRTSPGTGWPSGRCSNTSAPTPTASTRPTHTSALNATAVELRCRPQAGRRQQHAGGGDRHGGAVAHDAGAQRGGHANGHERDRRRTGDLDGPMVLVLGLSIDEEVRRLVPCAG